jgi:hypothetical protein
MGRRIAAALDVTVVQIVGDPLQPAGRVGIVCGSGGGSIAAVRRGGCQTLVTGELKLHEALEAEAAGLAVIAVGHHASEHFAMRTLAERTSSFGSKLATISERAATINLGTGDQLAFTSGTATWAGTLNITGAFVSGSSLNFGSSSGLSLAQLGAITLNGNPVTSTLDGSGFLLTGVVSGYSAWQSANGTTQAANLDHDNDGVSNGVEHFVFGTANSTGNSNPLPGVDVGPLSVTWTKAATYTGSYGTDFVVETSPTLSNPWTTEIANPNPGFTVTFPAANQVEYTFPAGTKNFARLKVVTP